MYKVDAEYPLTIAHLAQANGTKQFLVGSAMNANSESVFLYSKKKGKLARITYESISILRPSLLLGNRAEFRVCEQRAY